MRTRKVAAGAECALFFLMKTGFRVLGKVKVGKPFHPSKKVYVPRNDTTSLGK